MSDILVRCKVIAFFVTEANDPSVRPQTDVFKEYIEEAPCSKHHCIIGEASWGRHLDALGSIWKYLEASLEDIWEASGRQLGGIWETSGRYLGGIWDASGRHGLPRCPQGGLRGLSLQKVLPLSAKIHIFIKTY